MPPLKFLSCLLPCQCHFSFADRVIGAYPTLQVTWPSWALNWRFRIQGRNLSFRLGARSPMHYFCGVVRQQFSMESLPSVSKAWRPLHHPSLGFYAFTTLYRSRFIGALLPFLQKSPAPPLSHTDDMVTNRPGRPSPSSSYLTPPKKWSDSPRPK